MDIQWFSRKIEGTATIYETNITLNKTASRYFINTYAVLIGFDKDNKNIVIKALNIEEASLHKYNGLTLYKVSIKPTYGRINSKQLVTNIQKYYNFDFSEIKMYKFACSWNQEQKFLTIYLDKEVQG
ncbi:MAG TPA: hypothetical protein GX695_00030 [Acholeplasmataceae bacterium]|nr:hypothetical protein [Acholeplasmataceae bacterium]